jgi:hypothetical protein
LQKSNTSKHLALLFLPGAITLLSMVQDFAWLPVPIRDYFTQFCMIVAMVWAFHFPARSYKAINRWWVLGPLIVLIVLLNIPEGKLSGYELLMKKLVSLACPIIALVAYFYRSGHYQTSENDMINASRKVRKLATTISLLVLVAVQVALLFEEKSSGTIQSPAIIKDNLAPVFLMVLSLFVLLVAILTYYIEAVRMTYLPDESLHEKIEQIGEK